MSIKKVAVPVLLILLLGLLVNPRSNKFESRTTQLYNTYPPVERNVTNNYTESYELKPFKIDDTSKLDSLKGIVKCIPSIWGYSKEDAASIFPDKEYPRCESFKESKGSIKLDYKTNTLEINCNKGPARYITGNKPGYAIVNRSGNSWEVKTYPGEPVELQGHEEYILAECGGDGEFDLALTLPRYNQTLHQESVQKTRAHPNLLEQPLTFLHIACDSFSRRHFFRKLKRTVKFINWINTDSEFYAFDFKIHNIIGPSSIDNQAYIYSGMSKEERGLKSNPCPEDIWNLLRPFGFISAVLLDSCNAEFAPILGTDITVDYSINEFYCAAHKYTSYQDVKVGLNSQRCIGPQMSHQYIFDYAEALLDMYNGTNKWINMHLDAAHETSGQHGATLDEDLTRFLRKALRKQNQNVVIILEADHGMRFGDWWSSEEASIEWRLPAFFFILPRSIVGQVPGSYKKLIHNSRRLTTKIDQRELTMFIAELTAGGNLTSGGNLMTEFTQDDRSCRDIKVKPWMCSCKQFCPIEFGRSEPEFLELYKLLDFAAREAVITMNEKLFSAAGLTDICEVLQLEMITSAWGLNLNEFMELIKLQIKVKGGAAFEILFKVRNGEQPSRWNKINDMYRVFYRGRRRGLLPLYFNRLDKYEGPCEDLCEAMLIPAKFCICKQHLKSKFQSYFNK